MELLHNLRLFQQIKERKIEIDKELKKEYIYFSFTLISKKSVFS